ncbi:hypothetical protein ACFWIO_02775 [Streptomyces diastatochromogenes]|uniref:hypothetical protein n=1 Tax=Streptomyces diastatochromogenes TaxID=42236 RepID=UPI00365C4854
MPKRQTRAANLARQIQDATGLRYTDALKMCTPARSWIALADELRAVGLVAAATSLTSVAYVCAEAAAWYEAYGAIENAYYDTDYAKVDSARAVCGDAAEAALHRAGFETHSFDTDAEAYHAAFIALSKAGTVQDGRPLARAALGVISSDPLWCSDVIRTRGRAPFTYETAISFSGPDTHFAVAARHAARAMATASAVRFSGDEQWHEAASLMVEAVWYMSVAAGLPPLHNRRKYQDFYSAYLDGALPTKF